jgi:hypothetical protein
MRNTGIAFTAVAVAHLIAGVVTIGIAVSPSEQACPPGCDNAPGVYAGIAGAFLIGASVLYAAIGVPLWVVGARRASPPSAMSNATSPPRVRLEASERGVRLVF